MKRRFFSRFSFCNASCGFVWAPIVLIMVAIVFFYLGEHFEKKIYIYILRFIGYVENLTRSQKWFLFFKNSKNFLHPLLIIVVDRGMTREFFEIFSEFFTVYFFGQKGLNLKNSPKIEFFKKKIFFFTILVPKSCTNSMLLSDFKNSYY